MNSSTNQIVSILIIVILSSGCITTDGKTSSNDQPQTLNPPPTQPLLGRDQGELTSEDIGNCTIVTQYGGRVKSCYIQKTGAQEITTTTLSPKTTDITIQSTTTTLIRPPPEPTIQPDRTPKITAGKWTITKGNLNNAPNLHFIGEGVFNSDGSYRITVQTEEFTPSEGEIIYTGFFTEDGFEIEGEGASKIYQNGSQLWDPAKDRITATIDETGMKMKGRIESFTSFHGGGGMSGMPADGFFEFEMVKTQ